MEPTKLKMIEAKLSKMLAQLDRETNESPAAAKTSDGVVVIRRRKGKPDQHISR